MDFSELSSYNGENTVISQNEDGYAMGNLVRIISEQKTGAISGVYSNGLIRNLAKIGLMSQTNPNGLQKVGSNNFMQTSNSTEGVTVKGVDQVFAVDAQAPAGIDTVTSTISGGALESSNVDLTEELTSMIVTQRAFSASGKSISSSDDMLQEIISITR